MKLEQALKDYYRVCLAAREMHKKNKNIKQVEYFSCIVTALQTLAFLGEIDLSQEHKKVLEQAKES